MDQWEFNRLMAGYWRDRKKVKECKHTPEMMLFYRLCALFTLGSIVGFSLAVINRLS